MATQPTCRVFDRRLAAVLVIHKARLLGFDANEQHYIFAATETTEQLIRAWKADEVLVRPRAYSAAWNTLRDCQPYQLSNREEQAHASTHTAA
jgi:hypothetical protein